jgi:hypothetical protein
MPVVKQKIVDKDFNFCYNKEKDREGGNRHETVP